jgi:putative GTP pyrophosphokinase
MADSPEDWGSEYALVRPHYEECSRRITSLISDLLRSANVDVVQIEGRAKTVDSFVEKLGRKGRTDVNPFATVTDLIGLRVITYYLQDVETVGQILASEFTIDLENSSDAAAKLGTDQFGYRSAHFVAKLHPSRSGLAEWSAFDGLPIEIQVRTALQHAWAAVSHKVEYKAPTDFPVEFRRRLVRLSALFELADEQFELLRDERDSADTANRTEVGKGQLDIPLDSSSLRAYFESADRYRSLTSLLDEVGFSVTSKHMENSKRVQRDRSDLVLTLTNAGFTTLADFNDYVSDADRVFRVGRAIYEFAKKKGVDKETEGTLEDLLTAQLIADPLIDPDAGAGIYTDPTFDRLVAARTMLSAAKSKAQSQSDRSAR